MLMMVSTEKDDVNETTTSYGLLEEEELNISSALAWYIAVIYGPRKLVHQTGILVKIGPTTAEFNIFRVNDP